MGSKSLEQLGRQNGVRVIFATVALGMGVDIKGIRHVIHINPPYSIQACFQETGKAGRDQRWTIATLKCCFLL